MKHFSVFLCVVLLAFMAACTTTKYVPDGKYLLSSVRIKSDLPSQESSFLSDYLRQRSNPKWFSVLSVPLYIYDLSGRDSTKWINRALRRIGDAPVLYDENETARTAINMHEALTNRGYWYGKVNTSSTTRGKTLSLTYEVQSGKPIIIDSTSMAIADSSVAASAMHHILPKKGSRFDVDMLDSHRATLATTLSNNGYYDFRRQDITYRVDTLGSPYSADLQLRIDSIGYKKRHIGRVIINPYFDTYSDDTARETDLDTIALGAFSVLQPKDKRPYLRNRVLLNSIRITPDSLYRQTRVDRTYSRLATLGILSYSNIRFAERNDTILDAYITLSKGKSRGMSFSLDGTNAAGDLGAAASISWDERNLFRGAETFSTKLHGAYEAISGLSNAVTDQYTEFGVETSLRMPRSIIANLLTARTANATTELAVSYSNQRRPEFGRNIFDGRWTERWNSRAPREASTIHRIDIIDVSYVRMPWISNEYQEDYLNNSILKYNYDDQMIMRLGYGLVYSTANAASSISGSGVPLQRGASGSDGATVRFNIESSGALLYGLAKVGSWGKNADGRYKSFGIPFEQYVKADFDFSSKYRIDYRNVIAFHAAAGVGVPYANSNILPFIKRYFSGGANSVRGWSVRSLGPGRYVGSEVLDFMQRSGDIKLDLSAELRTWMFWKLNGAFFIDAGNCWTIRNYPEQDGGVFTPQFYKQLAASYGIGMRFDFDFFVLRFDGAMKAINPQRGEDHYPILKPKFSRDFAFHFAIGYPF